MTRIPALGPKRAFQLYRELGIGSIAELSAAIDDGRLKDLRGLGAKSEDKLRRGIELAQSFGQRVPLNVASDVAERIVAAISAVPGCERAASTRAHSERFRETIGDVDILAGGKRFWPVDAASPNSQGSPTSSHEERRRHRSGSARRI
jgi:DNA polymerase (family 10)